MNGIKKEWRERVAVAGFLDDVETAVLKEGWEVSDGSLRRCIMD